MNINDELASINSCLESYKVTRDDAYNQTYYPIFIVGAPRSGTTVLFQAICHLFNVGYPNNLIARFWKSPQAGYIIYRHLFPENTFNSTFYSSYGSCPKGVLEPHEFGYFFNQWFLQEPSHRLPEKFSINPGLLETMKDLFFLSEQSWIFKNLMVGMNIPHLKNIFPNAKFIFNKRNIQENAQSILRARKKLYGDVCSWLSVKPKDYNAIRLIADPKKQVVMQIKSINLRIEADLRQLNSNDYACVLYERFCDAPTRTLTNIAFLENLPVKLKLPDSFAK